MATATSADAVVTKPFMALTTAHFLASLGQSPLLLLPVYLEAIGATRAQIGLIMPTAAVGGLVFRPAIGWSLDRLGRKTTLLLGTLLCVASLVMLLAVRDLGPLVYLNRLLFGLGVGALFTGYFAFAADLVPQSRRTEGIALFGVSGLLPMAFNPFIDKLGIAPLDLRWFFPCLAVVIALSLPFLALAKEPHSARPKGKTSLRASLTLLTQRSLWPVWCVAFVFAGVMSAFMDFASVAAKARGVVEVGPIWLAYAAGSIGIRLLGAKLPDRLGTSNVLTPAIASYAVALLLAAHAQDPLGFTLAGLFGGFGHGYCFPILTSQVVTRAPEAQRGSAMSMFTTVWTAAALIVSPLMGSVADAFDDRAMFSLAALLVVGGMGAWAILEHRLAPR